MMAAMHTSDFFWQGSRACLKVALASFLASPPSALRTNRDWKGTSAPSSAFPVRLPPSQTTTCSLLFFACSRSIWWRWSEGEPWAVPPTVSNSASPQYVCVANNTHLQACCTHHYTVHKRILIPDAPFDGRLFAYESIAVLLYIA